MNSQGMRHKCKATPRVNSRAADDLVNFRLGQVTASSTKLCAIAIYDDKSTLLKIRIAKQSTDECDDQARHMVGYTHKIREFACYSAISAEILCHKMLEDIHMEGEYFQPCVERILATMKHVCCTIDQSCMYINKYVIPNVYKDGNTIADLYRYVDDGDHEPVAGLHIGHIEEEVKQALHELTDGQYDELYEHPEL